MSPLILAALDPFGLVMTIVGLGGLIFFHELGHFVACRLTGTRVETFSVGFGPKVFGWRRGATLYKIGAIPLGGYVKMAGENPGEVRTGSPDEFPNKSFGQRLFIMSNGVIFNVILALAFYVWAFGIGVPFPRAEIGNVNPGAAGWEAGLRVGDVVTHVNGSPILGFDDLKTEIAFSGEGETLLLSVRRDGTTLDIPVEPRYSEAAGMPVLDVDVALDEETQGVQEGAPLAEAGGRAGDVILAIDGRAIDTPYEIERVVGRTIAAAGGDADVLFDVRVRRKEGGEETLRVPVPVLPEPQIGILPYTGARIRAVARDSSVAGLLAVGDVLLRVNGTPVGDLGALRDGASPDETVASIELRRGDGVETVTPDAALSLKQLGDALAGYPIDMDSNLVAPRTGLPAAKAGLLAGDRIVSIGGAPVGNWTEIREAIRANGMKPLALAVEREGDARLTLTVTPAGTAEFPLLGYLVATRSFVHEEDNLLGAIRTGWHRTGLAVKSVVLTIRSLLTRRVSARHVGGPIALAEATLRMFDLGWARYLYILALISINLAILNILPIPVLDGGQIVLLLFEKARGKPLPERVVGLLQMAGLFLILGLLFLAFHNDIMRLLN